MLVGWEHFRIVPGFTATNDLDLYDMPWTHSLAAALVWSAVAALVAWRVWNARSALVVAIAVFSRWLLDLLVHAGDLTLAGNDTAHVGFGLWNHPTIEIAVEISTVIVGGVIASRAVGEARRRVLGLTALLVAFAIIERVMPSPASVTQLVLSAFASYVVLALAAWWAERGQKLRAIGA